MPKVTFPCGRCNNQTCPSLIRLNRGFKSLYFILYFIVKIPGGFKAKVKGSGQSANINLSPGTCYNKDVKGFVERKSQVMKDCS